MFAGILLLVNIVFWELNWEQSQILQVFVVWLNQVVIGLFSFAEYQALSEFFNIVISIFVLVYNKLRNPWMGLYACYRLDVSLSFQSLLAFFPLSILYFKNVNKSIH